MNYRKSRRARIIALGACAVCAQTLFIREILGIITGTELILGLALASWLFWIGAGGIIGGRLLRPRSVPVEKTFAGLSVSIALSVPIVLLFIRVARSLLVDPPGSLPDILPAAGLILISTAPFGLLYGAVYNFASAVTKEPGKRISTGIASAYILEAAGSIAGGVLLSLLLFAYLTQLAAGFAVAAIVTMVFLFTSEKGRRLGWVIVLLVAAIGYMAAPFIDRASMSLVFSGYEVMEIVPSRYSELCVTRNREIVSVFSGGARLFSHPDAEAAGERIHIPLLAHSRPSAVLLIGGGHGGGAEEALSHPGVESVDWIELDGNISEALDDCLWRTGYGILADRVRIIDISEEVQNLTGDGRFMLRGSGLYDVIIVNVPEPVNLRWNRYYTREFFEAARRSLAPGGILTLRHSSSENYISEGNAAVLGTIRQTLAASFEYVDMVPGGTVFFIASDSPVNTGSILARLRERRLGGHYLSLDELVWRLSGERKAHLASVLKSAPDMINTDLHPVLVTRELILHGRRAGSSSADFFKGMLQLPQWVFPIAFLTAAILLASFSGGGSAAKSAVFLTGSCSMTVQISLMFAFQTFTGILYYSLVMLTALFMAGAALGAYFAKKLQERGKSNLVVFHVLMGISAVLVPVWLRLQAAELSGHLTGMAGFMFLSLAGGLLTGAYYRTVVEIAWPEKRGAPPALFYSWDMFGACAGGLLAGTFLIPLSGLDWTAAVAAVTHLVSALLLVRKITPVH